MQPKIALPANAYLKTSKLSKMQVEAVLLIEQITVVLQFSANKLKTLN